MFKKVLDILDKPYKDDIYLHLTRNEKFNKTNEWFGLSFVFIFILIFVLLLFFIKNFSYVPPTIYQVSEKTIQNGEYKNRLITLSNPRITLKALQEWSSKAVNNIYRFDFNNFDNQLKSSRIYFTNNAYKAFVESIERVELKKSIVDKKQIISLTATETPRILSSIVKNQVQYFQVEAPAIIATTSGTTVYESYIINMLVVVESKPGYPAGLYIYEMNMKPTSSAN